MRILTPEELQLRIDALTASEGRYLPPLNVGDAPLPLAWVAMQIAHDIVQSASYFHERAVHNHMRTLITLMHDRYKADPEETRLFMDELQHVAIEVPPSLDGHRL